MPFVACKAKIANMQIVLISIVMGILPMLIYSVIVWWLDRWEKEPLPLVAAMFLWGFIPSACFAITSQVLLVDVLFSFSSLIQSVAIAPLTEEFIKGLALLLLFALFYREFDSILDGIVYGSLIGFGFAAIENVLYFIGFGLDEPSQLPVLIFLRAFVFGLNHAFYTSLTGMGFALLRLNNKPYRWFLPILGLMGAIFTHALHNLFAEIGDPISILFAFSADWIGILGVFCLFFISLWRERTWIQRHLVEEVENGIITAHQATTAASLGMRLADALWGWLSALNGNYAPRQHFYHLCTELAYKKHQLMRLSTDTKLELKVQNLREQVRNLSSVIQ